MKNTSPSATLAARLPKGNGLTRAAANLFHRRGDLIPFVGLIRVDEAGLDAEDNEHIRTSIARLEIGTGHLAADIKDLITACSTVATTHPGQGTLFPAHDNSDEERRELLGFLAEWGQEQDPPRDLPAITEMWNSWHGGFYDARLEEAPVSYLREFCFVKGVIAEDGVVTTVPGPEFSHAGEPEQGEELEGQEPEDGDAE